MLVHIQGTEKCAVTHSHSFISYVLNSDFSHLHRDSKIFPDRYTANPLCRHQIDYLIATIIPLLFSYPYPLSDYSIDFFFPLLKILLLEVIF